MTYGQNFIFEKPQDWYKCPTCLQTVWTTMGQHLCPGVPTSSAPWVYPNRPDTHPVITQSPQKTAGVSGWACPVCGSGNAPWVSQCPCQGRTGTTTNTNKVVVDTPVTDWCPRSISGGTDTCNRKLVDGVCDYHGPLVSDDE